MGERRSVRSAMQLVVAALADQQAELDGLLEGQDDARWAMPAPACPGWTVADVVLHLAQTDELGTASAQHRFGERAVPPPSGGSAGRATVDDAAAAMVERERGGPPTAVRERWRAAAAAERAAQSACDPHERLIWVAGDLAARTLATTRLSETWIHTTDVAEALGLAVEPTDRLWHVARLAWRTLPYAFARAGRSLAGPVAVLLVGPTGERWDFTPDGDAVTTIRGGAEEFCRVAGRRVDPSQTSLVATGPDAKAVLALVRTYA